MVETISPVVHGGRTKTYWASLFLHVVGATVAGALFGVALGGIGLALGAPWRTWSAGAIAFGAFVYLLREGARMPVPTPDLKRQVPDWWRTYFSPPVAALLYGLGLGVGFLTFLTYGTYVVVALASFALGDPIVGVILCGTFGLVRAAAIVGAPELEVLDRMHRTPVPRAVNALATGAVCAASVTRLV